VATVFFGRNILPLLNRKGKEALAPWEIIDSIFGMNPPENENEK
jgi:hypothetical protein